MTEDNKVTEMPLPETDGTPKELRADRSPRRNPTCGKCGSDPLVIGRRHVRLMPAPPTPGDPEGLPGLLAIVAFCAGCGETIQIMPIMHLVPPEAMPGESQGEGVTSVDASAMSRLPPPPKKGHKP